MTSTPTQELVWAEVNGVSIPLYQDSTTYGAFIAGSTYSQGSAYPGYRYRHDSDAPVVLTFGVTGLPAGATWRMANLEAQTYLTQVTLSADKAAVSESDDAAGRAITYTATRSIPEAVPLTPTNFPSITLPLQWTGTAGEADFENVRPTEFLLPVSAVEGGPSSSSIAVTLSNDLQVEPLEVSVVRFDDTFDQYASPSVGSDPLEVACIDDEPVISVVTADGARVEEVQEGRINTSQHPNGFWIIADHAVSKTVDVTFRLSGDAEAGADYVAISESVQLVKGADRAFVPLSLMEDITPENTESIGLTLSPSSTYSVTTSQSYRAAMDIVDDDYFVIGIGDTPGGSLDATIDDVESEVALDSAVADPTFFFGTFDDAWLPWMLGDTSAHLAAGGSADDPAAAALFANAAGWSEREVTGPLLDDDGTPIQFASTGDALAEAELQQQLRVGQSIAAVEEALNADGGRFKVQWYPESGNFIGRDDAGRLSVFDSELNQTYYSGTSQLWFLQFNDDGSIDKVERRFGEPGATRQQLQPSAKLQKALKDTYARTLYTFSVERRKEIEDGMALLGQLVESGIRLLPGAVVLDAQEALTGESAFRPGVKLSVGEQTASTASAAGPAALAAAAKVAKFLKAVKEGHEFEKDMIKLLKELEGAENVDTIKRCIQTSVKIGLRKGTVPDAIITGKALIEIKRVSSLQLTDQLRRQMRACVEAQQSLKYRLIVSPHSNLTGDFTSAIEAYVPQLPSSSTFEMTIEQYDPVLHRLVTKWTYEK